MERAERVGVAVVSETPHQPRGPRVECLPRGRGRSHRTTRTLALSSHAVQDPPASRPFQVRSRTSSAPLSAEPRRFASHRHDRRRSPNHSSVRGTARISAAAYGETIGRLSVRARSPSVANTPRAAAHQLVVNHATRCRTTVTRAPDPRLTAPPVSASVDDPAARGRTLPTPRLSVPIASGIDARPRKPPPIPTRTPPRDLCGFYWFGGPAVVAGSGFPESPRSREPGPRFVSP